MTPGSLAVGRAPDTPPPCAPVGAKHGSFCETTIAMRCADWSWTNREAGKVRNRRGRGVDESAQLPSQASSRAAHRRALRQRPPGASRLPRRWSDHPCVAHCGSPSPPLCAPSQRCGAVRSGERWGADERRMLSSVCMQRWEPKAPRHAEGWRGPAATTPSCDTDPIRAVCRRVACCMVCASQTHMAALVKFKPMHHESAHIEAIVRAFIHHYRSKADRRVILRRRHAWHRTGSGPQR